MRPGQEQPRILFAAAGTAGHIQPALAVAKLLQTRAPNFDSTFLGTSQGLEGELVPSAGFSLKQITKAPFPRHLNLNLVKWPVRFAISLIQSWRAVGAADLVIGFGGYVCASAYLAAAFRRVPIIVHEANRTLGMANRLGARFAQATLLTFPSERSYPKSEVVGLPLTPAIVNLANSDATHVQMKVKLAERYGFDASQPILAVVGGSLGAARINEVISQSLEHLLAQGWQIVHVVGKKNDLPSLLPGYVAMAYSENMAELYGGADLLITRAGAGTCVEILATRAYAIMVPLAIGNGEQSENAAYVASLGYGEVVANSEFTTARLQRDLEEWFAAAKDFHEAKKALSVKLDGAEAVVNKILAIVGMEKKGEGNAKLEH